MPSRGSICEWQYVRGGLDGVQVVERHSNGRWRKLPRECRQREVYAFSVECMRHDFRLVKPDLVAAVDGVRDRVLHIKQRRRIMDMWYDVTVMSHESGTEFNWNHLKTAQWNFPRAYPTEYENVVRSYSGRQRANFERALESLRQTPLSKKDWYLRPFLKCEFYNSGKALTGDLHNRVVSPRSTRATLALAAYLKPIEHRLYHMYDSYFGYRCIAKGRTQQQMAQDIVSIVKKFTNWVCISIDASRFDQHVTEEALRFEHWVYAQCFSPSQRQQLLKILEHQLTNKCIMLLRDGMINYTVRGQRMSGDINTALGNVVQVVHLLREVQDRGARFSFYDNGDDCLLFIEQHDEQAVVETVFDVFTEAGHILKFENRATVLEDIKFCQSHPVFDGEKYCMLREPKRVLSRDWMCFHADKLSYEAWVGAVGDCGLATTGGFPVYQNMYRAMSQCTYRRTELTSLKDFTWRARGMSRKFREPSTESRLSFYRAFGIPPQRQTELEDYYDNLVLQFDVVEDATEMNELGLGLNRAEDQYYY